MLSDGTCRTVSHGKREHIPGEGYRYVLHLNNGTYADNKDGYYWIDRWNEVDWIKYSELGAGIPGKPCVFPFKVNGIEFNECTAYQSPNGWPRCATKKNQDLTRVRHPSELFNTPDIQHLTYKGSWGFCGEKCPVESEYIFTKL